jgi:hypothetical protein
MKTYKIIVDTENGPYEIDVEGWENVLEMNKQLREANLPFKCLASPQKLFA